MAYDNAMAERILDLLMKDSRLSHREIASKINISPTTVGKILKDLEKDRVVQGYSIMVDWSKLDYDNVMCLQLAVLPGADVDKIGKKIKSFQPVKQAFYTMGEMTFACYAVCRNKTEAAELMKKLGKINGIEKLVCHTVLKQF